MKKSIKTTPFRIQYIFNGLHSSLCLTVPLLTFILAPDYGPFTNSSLLVWCMMVLQLLWLTTQNSKIVLTLTVPQSQGINGMFLPTEHETHCDLVPIHLSTYIACPTGHLVTSPYAKSGSALGFLLTSFALC